MARSTMTWLRAATVALLAAQTTAQTCYYPNGKEAPGTEKPCSSVSGSACCPDTWECLNNGLCYNPAAKIYGRYSCTDKDWKAPGCASNMCTYGGNAIGGESITQCANHNNDWCCNADNTNVKCCQESPEPRPFFQLQDGKPYATIGRNQASTAPTLASFTGLATSGGSGNSPSKTPGSPSSARASTTNSPSSAASSPSAVTSVQKSLSSGAGGVVTVERTIISTPSSAPAADPGSSTQKDSSGPNIGLIVGCAVGIPLALALLGIVFWMLRKRRQQKANPYKETRDGASTPGSPGFAGGAAAKLGKKETYRHSRPNTTEIDGHPTGPGRPVSQIPGRAELDSGAGFQQGHGPAFTPDTVGLGGGNGDGRSTWGTAPPGYSPNANQTAFGQQPAASELDGTSVMPVINEKPEAPQQYQAYRPPQPAAELPTIKTPPEDLEKQLHK